MMVVMRPRWLRRALWSVVGLATLLLAALLWRGFEARSGPPLSDWHRHAPTQDVRARDVDANYTWADYLAAEERLFAALRATLAGVDEHGAYRYQQGNVLGPRDGARDWNRSFESTPASPRGGVLLLHGLSDSPYSLRHLATLYEDAGYAVIAPRLPGHGTVPAGLLRVRHEDWHAVVRVAMRALRSRVGASAPLHVVGYSNGAALAVVYAAEAAMADDAALPRPDRLVLLSPMIGVSRAAWLLQPLSALGAFDYFAQARWLDVLPEFNPFKYNSFPVNGVAQSVRLTAAVQASLRTLRSRGRIERLPPVLAFQSVLDSTVETADVVHGLFEQLPDNGSELVLFDINRAGVLAPLLRPAASGYLDTLHAAAPRHYRLTLVGNRSPDTLAVGERSHAPGQLAAVERDLPLAFPASVYSLSHVALPFPVDDPLYGLQPRRDEDYGVRLGLLALHGERGALQVSAEQLQRLGCNPFFPYLADRVRALL